MSDQPNVVVITTHDTGRHFGCYGVRTVHSSAIDRIAQEGVRFDNHFAAVPICGASRASMMTGLYPQSHGQYDLPRWGHTLHDHVKHLSHHMRDAGYQTALCGLQHETKPIDALAFDHVDQPKPPRELGKKPNATLVADAACRFLQQRDKDKPFYLQVGFYEAHSPFAFGHIEPDHEHGVTVPPWIKPTGTAYELMADIQGAVREMDRGVDTIDRALHEHGLAENTLLVFTTDHGLELPRAKWHLFDPGIAIGMVARWPKGGVTGGRVCEALTSNVDFTPTVLNLLNLPGADALQGESMAALWRGESDAPIREHYFGYYLKTGCRCVRTNTHKLILQTELAHNPTPPVDIADPSKNRPMTPISLYDLVNDPLEHKNLADDPDHADTRDALLDALWQWMEQQDDDLLKQPAPSLNYDEALAPYHRWKTAGARAT